MARLNIFGAKAKYIAVFVGVSISILIWLNMSSREGFQAVPDNVAVPVPTEKITAEQKQAFAAGVIQLYNNIIVSPLPIGGVRTVSSQPPEVLPPPPPPPGAPPIVTPTDAPMPPPPAPAPAPTSP